MATIEENYVSFETAELLKENGFNEETEYVFSNNGELLRLSQFGIKDLTNADCNDYHTWKLPIEGIASIISAPTLQMAMKWLVRKHRLYVNVAPSVEDCHWTERWHSYVEELNKRYPFGRFIGTFNSHEQACEEAIKYCLKHLIK